MKILAQQGYGTGSGDSDKILSGLQREILSGAIISPKDYGKERTESLFYSMHQSHPDAERLFDPQYYATIVASSPDCRLGNLATDYGYFQARNRAQLESEATVRDAIKNCLDFQRGLDVSSAIAPNIVINRRFDSVDGVIAKNFARMSRDHWNDDRPLFTTLAIDSEALRNREELESFMSDLTLIESPPDGFYVIVCNPTSDIYSQLIGHEELAGWMFVNHVLSLNGFRVINGYSDILTPFLIAAGGDSGASGWFNTQKVFSLDRFNPPSLTGARQPIPRYLSKRLLNSLRFDELHRLRADFPVVVNGLPTDELYPEEEGSQPASKLDEILQTWDTLSSDWTNSPTPSIPDCLALISAARSHYDQISLYAGTPLAGRSGDLHLESLEQGVRLFAELAEIPLD